MSKFIDIIIHFHHSLHYIIDSSRFKVFWVKMINNKRPFGDSEIGFDPVTL